MACSRSLFSVSKTQRSCIFIQRRHRYKKKWAVNLPSKTPTELSLEHFDAFYKPLFGHQWPSIRVSLLSSPKYAALMNNASDSDLSRQFLEKRGAVNIIKEASKLMHKASHVGRHTAKEDFATNEASEEVQCEIGGASQELIGNKMIEQHSLEILNPVPQSKHLDEDTEQTSTTHAESTAESSDHDRGLHQVHDMKNVFMPDTLQRNSDLQYFMPTQQIFSEKEELRREEYSQNMFQEHPVSVSVLPGKLPMLPKSLTVMAFPQGDVSDFPKPSTDESHLLNYYLLDAASILPVLALDFHPGDNVLDVCSAPGGKTLALLQMIIAQGGYLTSNDVSQARLRRLKNVLKSYLPFGMQQEFVNVTEMNGMTLRKPIYDKVLVDAPCNSDRHVLMEDDNNLFKPGRIKDRLKLTTVQKDLLLAGIKSCKPGGSVVYSTCTLTAAQNDGVVQAAVEELWETSDIDVAVEDLSPLTVVFAPFFKFHSATRLGQLVLPCLLSNYGPSYFCKLRRLC